MHADLTTPADLAVFGQTISDLIRAERHEEAEALLRAALPDYPSPAAAIALDLAENAVRIEGWAAFNERIEALSAKGEPITAVWLHLSNYTDDADDGLRHPAIELGYLRDGRVAFSQASTDDLLKMSARYPARWTGAPDEDGVELVVHGLERLNDWLVKFDGVPAGQEAEQLRVSIALAEWFRTLRWQQAVHAIVARHGLTREIPVIVGSHDAGPWCAAIYRRSKPFSIATRRQPTQRETEQLHHDIQGQIGAWENVRASLEMMNGAETAAYYEAAKDVRHMADRWFVGTLFEGEYPLESDKADFERFLQRWRHHRDPVHFPAPAPKPAPSFGLRRIFGRKGL
jgi:hypothetical protein